MFDLKQKLPNFVIIYSHLPSCNFSIEHKRKILKKLFSVQLQFLVITWPNMTWHLWRIFQPYGILL